MRLLFLVVATFASKHHEGSVSRVNIHRKYIFRLPVHFIDCACMIASKKK